MPSINQSRGGRNRATGILRRKKVWMRETHTASFVNVTVKDLCEDFCARMGTNSPPAGATVGPFRVSYRISGDYPRALNSGVAIGIIKAAAGFPADNARVNRPVTERHADWIAYEYIHVVDHTTATGSFSMNTFNFERDWGSSRKLTEIGESVFFVAESNIATEAFDYSLEVSSLLTLA